MYKTNVAHIKLNMPLWQFQELIEDTLRELPEESIVVLYAVQVADDIIVQSFGVSTGVGWAYDCDWWKHYCQAWKISMKAMSIEHQ